MAMMAKPYPTSQYAATYRMPQAREREREQHHGFFASPTESEFSDHFDAHPTSVNSWDESRVADWLKSINLGHYSDIFTSNNITGIALMELDRDALRELGVKRIGDQIRITKQAKTFRDYQYRSKSRALKNRESLALLDHPQFTPPSSASPKNSSHSGQFVRGNRDQSKRISRQYNDFSLPISAGLQFPNSASLKSTSRPASPYVEQDRQRRGYDRLSPQKDSHSLSSSIGNGVAAIRTPASSTDNILSSRYASNGPRSAGMSIDTPQTARFNTHARTMSTDGASTNSILPTDKPLIRVIFDTGRSCVVNIDNCLTVEEVMLKTVRKGQLNESHVKNYCFYVLDGTEPNPALCRRINDAEIMRICSDKTRVERNRLILRKIHQGEPDDGQLKTAASIASQIHSQQSSNVIVPTSTRSQLKIEKIMGEALPQSSYPQSPNTTKERERHMYQDFNRDDELALATPRPRMKEVFGGRPPSALIASDLPTYFPEYDQEEIDRTVRMSIRRSRRISRATNRMSMVSNFSIASSLRDAPPVPSLPSISDAWLRDQPKGLRPLSVLRLGTGGSNGPGSNYRDSIASSVMLEKLDEESPVSDGVSLTDPEGHAVMQSYYDDGRSSIANSLHSGDNDTLNKRLSQLVQEDSEDSDDELNEYLDTDSWDNIKYMKGALIGQGSFGSVYLALHAVTGELMAVKQVEMPSSAGTQLDTKKNTMVEALKHEIDLLKELKHSNIVSYLGSNTEEKFLNIFLEYVPGGSVAKMLVTYGPLGESLIANFVRQILKGLAYLHSKDIIHRDIKGANILVDHQGSVKISDFGISKRVEASTLGSAKKAGQRVSLQGSVFWMAPEVVKQTAYTRKADIWSLGCLIVEMLTGQHPHPNCSQLQAIFKIGRGSEEARPIVPENASDVLKRFLDATFDIEHERRPEADELLESDWMRNAPGDTKPGPTANK